MLLTHTSKDRGRPELPGPLGTGRRRPGRWHSPGADGTVGVGARRPSTTPTSTGRARREAHRRTARRLRAGERLRPLGMTETRYLSAAKAWSGYRTYGTAIAFDPNGSSAAACPDGTWSIDLLGASRRPRTTRTPGHQPRLRPSAARHRPRPDGATDGRVAGSAGVFSTVQDVGTFAYRSSTALAGRPSVFPLRQSTLQLATTPQQPGAPGDNSRRRTTPSGKASR